MSLNEIATLIIALAAIFVSGTLTLKQADIALKQFTLSYIEMENANENLTEARKWLLDINKEKKYIKSFTTFENFQKYKNSDEVTRLSINANFITEAALRDEYFKGINHIQTILRARQEAAEAIVTGMLDEDTYSLIRHGDFAIDYFKLEDFILERHKLKGDSFSVIDFRAVVHKWKNTTFNIAATKNSTDWKEWYSKAEHTNANE